jgi:phosphatidylserine/phosphatidylglycerophosphate/cardiolipin synthase-like enzyme
VNFERLQATAAELLRKHGPASVRTLAGHLAEQWPSEAIVRATPDAEELLAAFTDLGREDLGSGADRADDQVTALAYLRGLADGYAQRAAEVSVETVWSGPDSYRVPIRATAAVLGGLVREARRELLLMTYSARSYQPLSDVLREAISRGVTVSVVVETLQGAGSALAGDEPYKAFTGIPGVDLWHWPSSRRTEPGAKMHAKLAVADRRLLLVSSANLTASGVTKNIEAGLLVRGGTAPVRAAEHIDALRAAGDLVRLG